MNRISLQQQLDQYAVPADLAVSGPDDKPVCTACGHKCELAEEGARGICRLRFNQNGRIMAPFGYVAGAACDPIEKKPLYHFYPGSEAFSFGMLGCNFQCEFCQNWISSQALKESRAGTDIQPCSAEKLISTARSKNCRVVAATYNEPLISTEWAVSIFRLARGQGMACCYVTNGFASIEVLDYLEPWLDAANVDVKCFSDSSYRRLGGRLQPVLDTVRELRRRGKWVETTTLVVPGFNDSEEELRRLTEFLASVDPLMPWHVSAYHADYKVADTRNRTPLATLYRAVELGREAGLKYIYLGNVAVDGEFVDTRCHECGEILFHRQSFSARQTESFADHKCLKCGTDIPGRWN